MDQRSPAEPEPETPRRLPRTYWVLWGGMLLNRLGGSVFLMLPLYLTRARGLSPAAAGAIVSLYSGGTMLAGPLGGLLADRVGRRATLLAGTLGAGALMLALGATRAPAAIAALTPLVGLFTDLCRPPLQAAVADLVPPAGRTRAYGLLYWGVNLGFAGAATLGGALAERSFGLLFLIDALTTWAYGAAVLLGVPETRPPVRGAARDGDGGGARALAVPFRDGPFVRFLGVQLLLLLAFAQVLAALPLDMRGHGLSTARIGYLLGLNGVVIVVAQPLALRLLHGLSPVRWLAAGAALTGVGLGATALAGGTPVFALAVVLWTLGEVGFSAATPTLIAELSPLERRGAYQGAYQLAWGLAFLCAPALGSFVLGRWGGPALWLGCLASCLIAAALHLRGHRQTFDGASSFPAPSTMIAGPGRGTREKRTSSSEA
jgi:MFS family permease